MTQSGGSLAARDRLGAARAQRRRPAARPGGARLHPPRAAVAARDRRHRAHRARRARRRAGPAPLRRAQPDRRHHAPPRPRRLVRRLRELHVVRDLRAAPLGREPHLGHDPQRRALARAPPELRRRLQRRRARRERDRRHRLRRAGAGGGRPARRARCAAPPPSWPARRAPTAASRSAAAARPTRSRRPTPSRASWPPAATSAAVRRGQAYLRSLTEPNGLVRYSRTSRQTPVWVRRRRCWRCIAGPSSPVGVHR